MEHYVEMEQDPMQKKRLSEYLEIARSEMPEVWLAEEELDFEIEYGKYLITYAIKIDHIDMNMNLGDVKTSKYGDFDLYGKLQPYVYSLLFRHYKGITSGIKKFNYYVLSKHKKKRCKLTTVPVTIDLQYAKVLFEKAIESYCNSLNNDIRPERINRYCGGCALKNVCKNYLLNKSHNETTR